MFVFLMTQSDGINQVCASHVIYSHHLRRICHQSLALHNIQCKWATALKKKSRVEPHDKTLQAWTHYPQYFSPSTGNQSSSGLILNFWCFLFGALHGLGSPSPSDRVGQLKKKFNENSLDKAKDRNKWHCRVRSTSLWQHFKASNDSSIHWRITNVRSKGRYTGIDGGWRLRNHEKTENTSTNKLWTIIA